VGGVGGSRRSTGGARRRSLDLRTPRSRHIRKAHEQRRAGLGDQEANDDHALNYILTLLNGFSNDTNSLYKAEEELRQASKEDPTIESLPATFTALYSMLGRRELAPIDDLS
jgi:hypothetical protein